MSSKDLKLNIMTHHKKKRKRERSNSLILDKPQKKHKRSYSSSSSSSTSTSSSSDSSSKGSSIRSSSSSSSSSSSNSSSSDTSSEDEKRRNRKKLVKKLKKSKLKEKKKNKNKEKKKKKMKKERRVKRTVSLESTNIKLIEKLPNKKKVDIAEDKLLKDISEQVIQRSKAMAPMTKEEWEKKQNVIRRVYDEETGRHRLIKGDGEVLEEIVSRDRQKEINRRATQGDGEYFQTQLKRAMK